MRVITATILSVAARDPRPGLEAHSWGLTAEYPRRCGVVSLSGKIE